MKQGWAIVTGGGSGLGLAIAKRLARQGYDIVIVGRNEQRLADAAAAIKSCFESEGRVLTLPYFTTFLLRRFLAEHGEDTRWTDDL